MEQALRQFREQILDAGAGKQALRLRGSGSKDWYGQALQGELLDTRGWSGIVDYDPTELVVTVRAGTSLSELEQALAREHQYLAFEPPHFGPGATVGGMVAAGLSGPRRQAAGAVRDFVLGASIMDGRGQLLNFGGRVMKNVAGYDVSRLMAGSLGTLALLLEVSLKVMPRPAMETTLRLELDQASALASLNQWGGKPLPLSASFWHDGQLFLRLSGAASAVRSASAALGGQPVQEADTPWNDLREQRHAFFPQEQEQEQGLWRLSVPSVTPPLEVPGDTAIEWGGALRWLRTSADAHTVRAAAARAGGHATLFRGADKSAGVFQPLQPALMAIHRRLKSSFDPDGVFGPGRMYPDF